MATPVLPYPDMDFTPLDILTAAEMDQMVANDQYLRDFCAGLADGTNLSDGVIQARNIDFTTLGGNYSLSEVDTGYTWINGKHIYKKTVAVASSQITANSDNELPHGISNFDRAIAVTGHLFLDNGVTRIATGGSKDHRYLIGNISSTRFTYFSTLATAGTYYFTFWYIKS